MRRGLRRGRRWGWGGFWSGGNLTGGGGEACKGREGVLRGGERMMLGEMPEVIGGLKARGMHVTVETAGTLWPADLRGGGIDLASVSPKLANSTPWEREGGRFAVAH